MERVLLHVSLYLGDCLEWDHYCYVLYRHNYHLMTMIEMVGFTTPFLMHDSAVEKLENIGDWNDKREWKETLLAKKY